MKIKEKIDDWISKKGNLITNNWVEFTQFVFGEMKNIPMMHIDSRFIFEYSIPSLEVTNIIDKKSNVSLDKFTINRGNPYVFNGSKYQKETGEILHMFLWDTVIEEINAIS